MMRAVISAVAVTGVLTVAGFFPSSGWSGTAEARGAKDERTAVIARAQVWSPGDIASRDIKAGAPDDRAFPFHATVNCDYLAKQMSGASPKFACVIGKDDEVKVKFGGTNAEVYAEVASTRLLWALGFAADRMYPVRVVCRNCPQTFGGIARENNESIFDPATIERKLPAREFGEEWSWKELDLIDEKAGGAPRAHRDALKLLAVFLQHTDTKAKQQRVICMGEAADAKTGPCDRPVMMLNDVGLTFGRANLFNVNHKSMHLVEWAAAPVWKDTAKNTAGCVGNLPKSLTGTLADPVISEEGRAFLADLLTQLTDQQIYDLFDISRVTLRTRDPGKARSGFATVEEWVEAFKQKRAQIVDRRCV
jgi:hypothetical protein